MRLHIPVSPGELIDRITILEVKLLYIKEKEKKAHVGSYLKELRKVRKEALKASKKLEQLEEALFALNRDQWKIEDAIRTHLKEIGPDKKFGTLVKSLHTSNNRRADIKRKIDIHLASDFLDEKQYV